jgi:hypothetical protein
MGVDRFLGGVEDRPMRLHGPAVAGVALALTAAAPAPAAPTAIYGGHTSYYAPFSLRVGANGSKLTGMLLQVDFRCDDGSGASWSGRASFQSFKPATAEPGDNVLTPARISRRGTFRATGEAAAHYGEDKIGAITEKLRGTIRRGIAHGTYSATLVMHNADTGATVRTCRSGTVRWEARSAPGLVYAGQSSDGQPLVIERSRDGRRIGIVYVAWTAPCQSGGAFEIGEGLTNFTVAAGGRFGDRWNDETKLGDGGSDVRAYRFDGTLGASRAFGTFGVQITQKDAAGAVTETCESTVAPWTARSTKGAKVKPPETEIRIGP